MACRPPANATYLTIGQDLFSINEYVASQYNHSLHRRLDSASGGGAHGDVEPDGVGAASIASFVPAAFMVYTDIETLKGLWEPADYGSGVEYADGALDMFPAPHHRGKRSSTGLQIGLWLNGTQGCLSVCEGEMDDQIARLISYLERSRASKIFLRLGYEFDNPSFGYSDNPEVYVLAFRKIVSDCRENLSEEALGRVLFVWHSWAAPMAAEGLTLDKFYPGDGFVDWIGISIFQQVFPWSPDWGGRMSDVENVLEFAKEHDKPTIIAESTPFGGIELKQASNESKLFLSNHEYDKDDWDRWFGNVIDIINRYDISMWCYINCDWEQQPMWHGVGFGQTLLSSNSHVMSQWHDLVVKNGIPGRTFLASGSLEQCGLNYVPVSSDETDFRPSGDDLFDLSHFYSFILVPFLVASGAFFVPYFILGGHRARPGGSSDRERMPLLSKLDESRASPAQSHRDMKPSVDISSVDGIMKC
ncbi:hypothetical protein ACHAWF_003586 [Thalassiosira exigua]